MLDQVKLYTDKVTVPVTTLVRKVSDKLSPAMRKVFCVALVLAWIAVLLPVTLLKIVPVVGTVVLVAWMVLSLLVGKVVYDVWQTAKSPDAGT